jgi:hypothetical protein
MCLTVCRRWSLWRGISLPDGVKLVDRDLIAIDGGVADEDTQPPPRRSISIGRGMNRDTKSDLWREEDGRSVEWVEAMREGGGGRLT